MKNTKKILNRLSKLGIRMSEIPGGKIRLSKKPPVDMLTDLGKHKAALLSVLRGEQSLPAPGDIATFSDKRQGTLDSLPGVEHLPTQTEAATGTYDDSGLKPASDQEENITERAAILEYDGGLNREDAEDTAAIAAGPCFCCKGSRWWVSIHGPIVCGTCHPPGKPDLVARWIGGEQA